MSPPHAPTEIAVRLLDEPDHASLLRVRRVESTATIAGTEYIRSMFPMIPAYAMTIPTERPRRVACLLVDRAHGHLLLEARGGIRAQVSGWLRRRQKAQPVCGRLRVGARLQLRHCQRGRRALVLPDLRQAVALGKVRGHHASAQGQRDLATLFLLPLPPAAVAPRKNAAPNSQPRAPASYPVARPRRAGGMRARHGASGHPSDEHACGQGVGDG